MHVLITGGAGFIGSHLVDTLLARKDRLTLIDDFNDSYDPDLKRRNLRGKSIEIEEGDIRDRSFIDRIVSKKPDIVVHLAARVGVRPSVQNPALYAEVNITGTLGILEACRRHGVRRFVFASSSSVYGNNPVPFSEKDENPSPVSPYGATKLTGEHMVRIYTQLFGLQATCLRFFTVYGPRQRPDMAIYQFTRWILEEKEIPLFAHGKARRDFTYIDDIIQGVVRALDTPEPFAIYNLGESRTVELPYLISLLESALGKKATIRLEPEQSGDVRATYADIALARDRLGYNPQVPIEEGIRRFVEWFKKEVR